ncbi:hypothetical protein [Sphingopyxis sp. BSNA05]|uniref:hypothetical protein n=1 Tax=Sphingopyxis sp. BSNA05 TaxID=1236614 RepID=UPI00349F0AEE
MIAMTLQADVYWSFRSPYSYLATRRYVALTQDYDLKINQRFVYPLAIREPDFSRKPPQLAGLHVSGHVPGGAAYGYPDGTAQSRPDRAGYRHPEDL